MITLLRGYLYLAFYIPFTALMAVSSLIFSLLDKTGGLFHRNSGVWANVALFAAGIKVKVIKCADLSFNSPLIFMSNHQGNFDIPSLYKAIPVSFAWIAKEELFKIPIFGAALKRAGCIPVDRSDGMKSLKSLLAAAETIKQGKSVVIFPEGTRSQDGTLLPFKRGGFILAIKAGVPVVPIAISGSLEANPPKSVRLKPGEITISIGTPIDAGGKSADTLLVEVKNAIQEMLDKP